MLDIRWVVQTGYLRVAQLVEMMEMRKVARTVERKVVLKVFLLVECLADQMVDQLEFLRVGMKVGLREFRLVEMMVVEWAAL